MITVFSENGKLGDLAALKQKSGVTDAEWEDILQYTSQVSGCNDSGVLMPFLNSVCILSPQVLSNLVNYKSFGFSKIIPRVPEAAFAAVVQNSVNAANALPLWNEVGVPFLHTFCLVTLTPRLAQRPHLPNNTG